MNLTKTELLDELSKNNLDHIVTWYDKRYHNEDTRGKEGLCSRAEKCKSVKAQAKYTVLVRLWDISVHTIALCEECYKQSPYKPPEDHD